VGGGGGGGGGVMPPWNPLENISGEGTCTLKGIVRSTDTHMMIVFLFREAINIVCLFCFCRCHSFSLR